MIALEPNIFHSYLRKHDEDVWSQILAKIIPSVHPVDQTATRIWFSIWPLKLSQALQRAVDPLQTAKRMQLDGNYRLDTQINSSVEFLYGARYWPAVKKAVLLHAESSSSNLDRVSLEGQIREIAGSVAAHLETSESLLLGITAIAIMTLQQVGIAAFSFAADKLTVQPKDGRSPDQVLKTRARESRGGVFSFLHAIDRKFTITFDENKADCGFQAIRNQDLSMASASDKRDYKSSDQRRIAGPIPAQCRSGACGYCWIVIIFGKEKLSEITPFEKKRLRYFGYTANEYDGETHPPIRLACHSRCFGDLSIVIPPWNGVLDDCR
jgi:ferredoxin